MWWPAPLPAKEWAPCPAKSRVVHLDMRHVKGIDLHQRFPGISAFLARYGLDLSRDLIPVRPAAHYLMGGIKTDLFGRTTLPGLYAAGEAACTGVHGANRLASNSLLEGLVFGARAAQAMLDDGLPLPAADSRPDCRCCASLRRRGSSIESDPCQTASRDVGLRWPVARGVHAEAGDRGACRLRPRLWPSWPRGREGRRLAEALAMSRVAHAILASALARTESRGAHFRNDFPQPRRCALPEALGFRLRWAGRVREVVGQEAGNGFSRDDRAEDGFYPGALPLELLLHSPLIKRKPEAGNSVGATTNPGIP